MLKARLVAKGYTQTQWIRYDEIFSLTAKTKSVRIMPVIATFYDYEVWKMDVKPDFFNGKLIEDVFLTQLEGIEHATYPNKVCNLKKLIYGLK